MTRKLDDAYNRLDRFESLLRKGHAFTGSLHTIYQDDDLTVLFEGAVAALCDDIRFVLDGVCDREEYREILHDLVMIDSEERAIGGGLGFKARRDKAWARASELFEP